MRLIYSVFTDVFRILLSLKNDSSVTYVRILVSPNKSDLTLMSPMKNIENY